jgi:hypothetical protein
MRMERRLANPYSHLPDMACQVTSINWYRWGGAAKPGLWNVSVPSLREGRTFHACAVDDFGSLVEVGE